MRRAFCGTSLIPVLLSATIAGQSQDLADTKDHPSISRYAGSQIVGYDVRKFDELILPLGPVAIAYPPGAATAKKNQKVEGRVTRILYVAPPDRSTLEVLRNYEQELKKGGFQTLYACATTSCGSQDNALAQFVYPQSRAQTLKGRDLPTILTMPQETRYVAAKRTSPRGDMYASVFVAKDTNPGGMSH